MAITTCGRSSRWSLECPKVRRASSTGLGELVVGGRVGQFRVAVGGLDLPVRRGRVHEQDVQVEVEQVRHRREDLRGDLVQGVEQEVHRPVGLIVRQPGQAVDGHPLGDPTGGGQLGAGFQGALRDQGEHHPLDRLTVQPPPGGDLADGRADPEPFPQPVQGPCPAEAAGIEHLDLPAPGRRRGLFGGEVAGDRGDQPGQRVAVDLVGAPEVVDHFGGRGAGLWVALVVRQLQVGHHRAVPVGPPTLPQVHDHTLAVSAQLT
jgi:hypothetical protein